MAETADRIVIIGGGASGLMAAIQASQAGVAVTILEHKDRVGKKNINDWKREVQSYKY